MTGWLLRNNCAFGWWQFAGSLAVDGCSDWLAGVAAPQVRRPGERGKTGVEFRRPSLGLILEGLPDTGYLTFLSEVIGGHPLFPC